MSDDDGRRTLTNDCLPAGVTALDDIGAQPSALSLRAVTSGKCVVEE